MDSAEVRFIAMMRALATDPAARGLNDDAAVIAIGGETLVITHDMMIEGIHWLPGADVADIAWKLVATNLSDLAAKGAAPIGVLLGYTLGDDDLRFAAGLAEALAAFGVALLGGDTVSSAGGSRSHGLTALGRATHCPVPARSGAKIGDTVWITGAIGAAMIGFEALRDGRTGISTDAFRRPVPRLAEGTALAPVVSAMMDVSDGLLIDASRIALASGVTIALDSAAIPFAASVPAHRRRDAMAWGDDYELLFTLRADCVPPCAAYAIGQVIAHTVTQDHKTGANSVLLDAEPPQGELGYWHDRPGA